MLTSLFQLEITVLYDTCKTPFLFKNTKYSHHNSKFIFSLETLVELKYLCLDITGFFLNRNKMVWLRYQNGKLVEPVPDYTEFDYIQYTQGEFYLLLLT